MRSHQKNAPSDLADPKRLIELEEELLAAKQASGITEKPSWWVSLIDRILRRVQREKVSVNRSKYIKLALTCGWLCGAHRFYTRQRVLGTLYLLFFWTGVPLAMTLIDLMIVLPMKADENGNVLL